MASSYVVFVVLAILASKCIFVSCEYSMDEFQQLIQQSQKEIHPLTKLMHEKNVLNYGDKCNPATEQIRARIQYDFIRKIQKDPGGLLSSLEVGENLEEILNAKDDFCNGFNFLECNAATKTCDCVKGNSDELQGIQVETKRQGDKCVAVKGTLCSPPEAQQMSSEGNQATIIVCEDGTKCFIKGSKNPCTLENVTKILLKEFEYEADEINKLRTDINEAIGTLIKKSTQLCSCEYMQTEF